MNRYDALERELTAWLIDTAMPRNPEYTTDIVQLTATMRQRPRWTRPERWIPMTVITVGRRTLAPFPWRTVGLLALLVVLLTAAAILYAGSHPRFPAPFGLAANGLVAYAQGGDILTVDPATGARTWVTSGNEEDYGPRWSLDGTRLAFLRNFAAVPVSQLDAQASAHIDMVVIVDRQGDVIAKSGPIPGIDADAVAWSHDGKVIAVGAGGSINLVDAAEGTATRVAVGYGDLDFYWRPGPTREILFHGETSEGRGLVVADVDDPAAAKLVVPEGSGRFVRPNGWAADGRRAVYTQHDAAGETFTVHVVDIATGVEAVIDAGFAHVSNDGKRLLAIDSSGKPCVASIDGGPCIAIADREHAYADLQATGAFWAPNDEWVIVRVPTSGPDRGVLLDPSGGTNEQPDWLVADAESWQRVAP